jgi:TM2 domain-containing membrane protein YozV/predicted Ser/Thr protein kinase
METERICPNCRKPLPPDVPLGLCPECLIKSGFPTETGAGAGRFVPPPVEELAKLFPQFEILGLIGKGGMGAVYKARQPGLDRFIALKILPPAVASDPGFAERFNREARALARLSHPNIVVVYDFGKAGDLHYLVMEFVDGANLREVEQAGKLSPEQALAIVPQICEALQFAHNEGIVHRDIKPENLLLDKKGRIKITDFGIAKIVDAPAGKAALTGAKDVVGTPHYMAPEQIETPQAVDHRADIYSLGVVFYEMLTGELPLGKFAPPSKKAPVDVRLDDVVLHTLEKEPEKRYQQASELKTDVETISTTAAPPPPSGAIPLTGAVPPLPPEAKSDKVLLPAFLLAFFFGVFGAHRFYVGKIGTGFLQLFTLGGFGIWATIDWILILCSAFTDGQGRRITEWVHSSGPRPPVNKPPGKKPPQPPKPAGGTSSSGDGIIVAPAVALMIAGFLKLFSGLKVIFFSPWPGYRIINPIFFHLGVPNQLVPQTETVLFTIVPALVILFGATEMIRIRSYAWSLVGAIVAIMFCSLMGFPAGIWALIILLLPTVRERFINPPALTSPEKWPWLLVAIAVACLMWVLITTWIGLLFQRPHAIPLAIGTASASVMAPPRNMAEQERINKLDKDMTRADAELAQIEARFKAAEASARDVQLARDKDKLATAQFLLADQSQGYQNGQVSFDAYQQDKIDVSNAEVQLREDRAAMQDTNAQITVAGNTATFAVVSNNGTAPLSYQWYYNGTTNATAVVTNKNSSGVNSPAVVTKGNPNGEWALYIDDSNQTDVVSTPASPGSDAPSDANDQTIDIGEATDFARLFTVEPGGKLTMNVDRGDVHISGADQNTVEIHVEREVNGMSDDSAYAKKLLTEEHVTLKQTGNEISITAENPPSLNAASLLWHHANLDAHYQITVPRQFEVHSETSGGDMSVSTIQGSVNIKTMGGRLDCHDINGNVEGNTMGGDVHAAECNGELRLQTMGGQITLESFTGPDVQAKTQGGSVSAEFTTAPTSDCELSTSGGNVTARLPGDAALNIDAHTEGGDINTDFRLKVNQQFANGVLKGAINGGGPTVRMETLGGNIEVLKR